MTLVLHSHPLSSFCQKVLIALYENETPFEAKLIDFFDPESRAAFLRLWPMGKIPVLRDEARDRTVPEATIIIEYLAQHHPGRTALVPPDPDLARETRFRDRFYDLYVDVPMQKIVTDRLRPAGQGDAFGVAQAKEQLRTAYGLIEEDMAGKRWAMGDAFTMADCAAAPALAYANRVVPFADHRQVAAYFDRLVQRPSFARVLAEAEPYQRNFPQGDEP
jgi:glutathione S-transferase